VHPISFGALEDWLRNVSNAAELHHSLVLVKLFAVAEEVQQRECSKMPVVDPKLIAHPVEKVIFKKRTIRVSPVIDYQSAIENYSKFHGIKLQEDIERTIIHYLT